MGNRITGSMAYADVILKKKSEKAVLRRHPWIYTGAILRIDGQPGQGDTVRVKTFSGDTLAFGSYSPCSQIAVRIWSFTEDEREIGPSFFRECLQAAIQARQITSDTFQLTADRLVNAEADGLPGLIVDHYGPYLVCQFLTAGAEKWRADIVNVLFEQLSLPVVSVYDRSDVDVRIQEGLELRTGLVCGHEPPDLIEIRENNCLLQVDIRQGHKTGFYLDQKRNRELVARYCPGKRVLNCFAYSGAFGIAALKAEADHVSNVEISDRALDLAERNRAINSIGPTRMINLKADVFSQLRLYRDTGQQFDLIILDPPKFAQSKGQIHKAARGYKDINLLAMKLLKPGGILVTFSCSGHIGPDLFQKIIADAAVDASCQLQVLENLSQNVDHPWTVTFPEGHYLKGFIARKMA